MLHYQLFWKADTKICHILFLILVWVFMITNDDVNNENFFFCMALPVLFWQFQPWALWVKIRNFFSSDSNYHRCKIFTSRYMFSKQAKTIVSKLELYCRWENSPVSNMASIFAKNVCDTLSNNMKLMLINAETNAALNLQGETVFLPQDSVHGYNVFVGRWHQ